FNLWSQLLRLTHPMPSTLRKSGKMSKASQNRKTLLDKVVYFFTWLSINYSVHINTYMMDPWERRIF
ncbi:hypothetical protein BSL78_15956, partial [Apostichopus japonicus]